MATWCQPCKEQIANLKSIQNEYADRGVTIISVDVDPQDTSAHLLEYRTERGATWQFVLDANGIYLEPKYSATSIPTIVIVNKDGQIAKRNVGLMSVDALKNAIDPLL
jgi:thiol-disulfide isomerase/thioredoxin